ncbi:MAG: hypothetical protein AAF391_03560 [Bacteroidota bacterium]
MTRVYFLLAALLILSTKCVLAQETESESEYSDYSYLWAEDYKKKKKKKKGKKKNTKVDSVQLNTIPLLDSLKTDSLRIDLLTPLDTLKPDSSQFQLPEQPLDTAQTIEDPIEGEVTEKERTKKERVPISDFRTPLTGGPQGGSFTGGFTYTTIGDEGFVGMVLSPEFNIGKVGVGLNVPILYGLDSKSIRTEIFKDGVGVARLIRYIRYGVQKQDPVYVKVGQLQGTMIGFGGLVNNYTNSTSYEKRKVGLHYDINYKGFAGIEGMYSDFNPESQNLLVFRPYVRPLAFTNIPVAKTLEFGITFLSDKDQTSIPTSDSTSTSYAFTSDGVKAFGIDMGITVVKVPFIQIDVFGNYSSLNIKNDSLQLAAQAVLGDDSFKTGSGISFGANFRLHFIADVFSTDIRIERLRYTDHYLPQFFDANYEISKDARIFSLVGIEKKSGIYGSLTGHVLQKVKLGGSLLIPDDISETAPAVVQVNADMTRLANKFSVHGSYIKGNLTDLGDAFKFDERSLAKLRFIYHMNKFLATGVDYYWAFTPVGDGSYQATKYVMPYFGVSIEF